MMSSRYGSLLAVLVLASFALPAAASDLDRLSVYVALDPWSVIGVDYRRHHHYDRHWPRYGYRYYGHPYGWNGRYYHPPRYWAPPRYYGHHRYYRDPRYGRYDRRDDHRWGDRRWHREDNRRDDRDGGRRHRRGD